MKVIYSETPTWFFNSPSFSGNIRRYDHSTFPDFISPNNKYTACMLRQYEDVNLISNGIHPLQKKGYNLSYGNFGTLTNYSPNERIKFTDLGFNNSNPQDETQWNFPTANPDTSPINDEKIVWINGEGALGYSNNLNANQTNTLQSLINNWKSAYPNNILGLYSWNKIQSSIISENAAWISNNTNDLMSFYNNLSIWNNPIFEIGFDASISGLYAYNEKNFDQCQRMLMRIYLNKLKYPNKKYFPLMWVLNEMIGFPGEGFSKYKRQDGIVVTPSGVIPTAPVDYLYNMALIGMTIGDGLLTWDETMITMDKETPDLEVDYSSPTTTIQNIGGQNFLVSYPRRWKGNQLYMTLAIWQVSQYKTIIEDSTYSWIVPDFKYNNGTLRTGDFKHVPYNKANNEPSVILKYNSTKTECLVLALNCYADNETVNEIRVLDATTGLDAQILLKGTKAELVKILL